MSPQLRIALALLIVVAVTWLLIVTLPMLAAFARSVIVVTKRQFKSSRDILAPEFIDHPPVEKPGGDEPGNAQAPSTDKGENHRDVPQFL